MNFKYFLFTNVCMKHIQIAHDIMVARRTMLKNI